MNRIKILFGWLLTLLICAGCEGELTDLHQFVAEAKAAPYQEIDNATYHYQSATYQAAGLRSPFARSNIETARLATNQTDHCPQPEAHYSEVILESTPAENLIFKGTIKSKNRLWGLLQDQDGTVYSVCQGDRLGSNNGLVRKINANSIIVAIWLKGNNGCWQQREVELNYAQN